MIAVEGMSIKNIEKRFRQQLCTLLTSLTWAVDWLRAAPVERPANRGFGSENLYDIPNGVLVAC
jgi:hypothetical protein